MARAFLLVLMAAIVGGCASDAPREGATDPEPAPAAPAVSAPAAIVEEREPPPIPVPGGFWTENELRLLDRGLRVLNCTRADLGFQKRPIEDPFRLEVVNRALDDPLSVGAEAQAWDEAARSGFLESLLERARGILLHGAPRPDANGPDGIGPALGSLGEHLPVEAVLGLLETANGRRPATDVPDPAVLRKALLTQVEQPSWVPEARQLGDEEFLKLAAGLRTDSESTLASGLVFAVEGLVGAIWSRPLPPGEPWKGVLRVDTQHGHGKIVLYGHADDVHDAEADGDALLVIDLGGNDTWTRGASATVLNDRPVSVCIDLSGNDRYVGREDLSFGAALGGVAIQWDYGGDDLYDAGHASLGAGICGVGILVDEFGDDIYRCRDFGIGAGAFGIGLLLDKVGNDLYHCDLYGEGFAATRGCGVLVDMEGNDTYDAGGAHVHAPLYSDRYQSLSQGFSIGMRPDASGGVGVLVDLKGNDRYTADIYGQGASYWYALGILVDDDGNDTYNLGQYGQGSGIHLAAGILVDRAGSDLYYLKNGVGMGGAHDYSVGMLVDRGGDDYYAGSGGTQGGALTNSVALLFDGGGNDGYAAVNEGAQGYASPARGTGGIGLLLDAGGKDVYTESERDGRVWGKEFVGAGLDEPSEPAAGGVGDPGATAMTPEKAREVVDRDGTVQGTDGKAQDDIDRLWKMASEWEVGDNRVIVPIARERLVALGIPALVRAVERVGDKHGLEFRACEFVFSKFPRGEVVPRLLEKTRDADLFSRRGAVRALAGVKAEGALGRFVEMLEKDPETRGAVLGALSALKKAPPAVKSCLRSPKEGEAVQAVLCLASVGDADAVETLLSMLGPGAPFPVRMAAWDRLGAMGEAAVPGLAELASNGSAPPMARRNALRALGRTKCEAAAPPLAEALRSADRLLRLSAMQGAADLVQGLGQETSAALADALAAARAAETDPFLKRWR